MAQYDITATMSKYLDRHMALHLVGWLQDSKIYPESDIAHAKLELASQTKAADLAIQLYKDVYKVEEVPEAAQAFRKSVLEELKSSKEACGQLLDVVRDTDLLDELMRHKNFNMMYLTQNYEVTEANLDALLKLARLSFDCSLYSEASKYLTDFLNLSNDQEKNFWALWGRLASLIMETRYQEAHDDLQALQRSIDEPKEEDPLEQLQQRTWLIHWSMFVLLNLQDDGVIMLSEFLFQEKLLNAIQTNCPHILRYLTVAVILNKRRNKNSLKDLVRVLVTETEQYSDPVTEFLLAVYVEFDFETASDRLRACRTVLKHDFFLSFLEEEFMASARQLMFDTYCRIHRCIDIDTLVKQLDINKEDAEPTIVELIRQSGVSAKIDSSNGQVVMTSRTYNQIIDKTKGVMYRSKQLMVQVEKKFDDRADRSW